MHNVSIRIASKSTGTNKEIQSVYFRWAQIFTIETKIHLFHYVAWMGEKRNVYRLLVGKPEGKKPLGTRWMDNIKKDLLEIGLNVVDWTGLALDRYRWRALVNSVMNLQVP
jgi:hypothetical protein